MGTAYRIFTGSIVGMVLASLAVACDREQERPANGADTASAAVAEVDRSEADMGTKVNVKLSEWTIEPSEDSLARGQATFAVENTGTIPHSLEIRGPGGNWTSPPIPPAGGSVLMSMLIAPGEYELSCPDDAGAHKTRGMLARVIVY